MKATFLGIYYGFFESLSAEGKIVFMTVSFENETLQLKNQFEIADQVHAAWTDKLRASLKTFLSMASTRHPSPEELSYAHKFC